MVCLVVQAAVVAHTPRLVQVVRVHQDKVMLVAQA